MTITALPTPPSSTDPVNFSIRGDAFFAALPNFVTEVNAAVSAAGISETNSIGYLDDSNLLTGLAIAAANAALNAPGTSATSTTSLTIGTGSKSFTLAQTGKAFAVGQFVIIANTTTPANYMQGQITSFTSGTGAIVVSVTTSAGSGTFTAWTISLTAVGSGVTSVNGDTGAVINVVRLNDVQTVTNKEFDGCTITTSVIDDTTISNGAANGTTFDSGVITASVISSSDYRAIPQKISASQDVFSGVTYCYDANINMNLPATPTIGMWISFKSLGYYPTATVTRNGKPIMSTAADLVLDNIYSEVTLCYVDGVRGWVIVS